MFRYIGITDECVECQKCGKQELKSTVVLAMLDADGNVEEITYYGSTCAARALAVKGGGRAVLDSARAAHERTLLAAKDARRDLEYYGIPERGGISEAAHTDAVVQFIHVHRNARWARAKTTGEWIDMVDDMIIRKRAAIAEAALLKK